MTEPVITGPMAPATNGPATAGMVLGVVGAVLGLVPLFAIFAIILGLLALIFGISGRRRHRRGETLRGKGAATAGVVLGLAAIGLGVWGLVIVNEALSGL